MTAQRLYGNATGRGSDQRRHLIRGTGDGGFPRSLCQESVVLRDDPLRSTCTDCRLVASTELTLALDALGFADAAIAVTRRIHDLSFETQKVMTDLDQATEGERREMWGGR